MEGGSVSITLTTDAKGRPTGAEGEIPRAGPFRIDGLEDGSYGVLAATRSKDGRTTFASTPVTLAGHSVEGLRIEMRPGVALRVEVKMAEENAAPPSRIGFVPLSTEGWGPMMDIGPPGGDDVPYRTGLPPGRYDVALMQLRGYAVASIVLNGTPVPPGAEVDLESSESVLTYTLTTHLGAVTGTVRDSDGQTVADAAVVLAPESFAATGQDRLSLPPGNGDETTSDDGGRFSFSGLAPGRYKAIAMKGDGRFRAFDVGTMRDRMRTADVVVVSADQSVRIDVEVGK